MAYLLLDQREGILNYCRPKVLMDGNIKTLIRRGRSYRDMN